MRKDNSEEDGPPDLQEIITSLKVKIKKSFKLKNIKIMNKKHEESSMSSCSCDKKNKNYLVDIIIKCSLCEKILKQKRITNPYKVAALLVVISYGTSQFIDYAVTNNRYPLDVEYAVMDSCSNSYKRTYTQREYGKKKSICFCALEDTMNEISYARYLLDNTKFLNVFKKNTAICIKQQG